MPKFTIHLITSTIRRQARTFNAATEEDAQALAEAQDWSEWPDEEDQYIDTGIDWIEID